MRPKSIIIQKHSYIYGIPYFLCLNLIKIVDSKKVILFTLKSLCSISTKSCSSPMATPQQLPWEKGALAPSSSSSPFRHFPFHLPTLLVAFVAKPVSLETLSTSSEVLSVCSEAPSYVFVVFSFINNCITQPSTINPPLIGINDGSHPRICSLCYLLGIFRFDFFKIRFMHFRM